MPAAPKQCVVAGAGGDLVVPQATATELVVFAGDAGDQVHAPPSAAEIHGGAGGDNLYGSPGADYLDAGAGGDQLFGYDGADVLVGADGNDNLFGGKQADALYGGEGNDQLRGDSDNLGNVAAPDLLSGGPGNDTLRGDGGDDLLLPGSGTDTVLGGAGNDRIHLCSVDELQAKSLDGGGGTDVLESPVSAAELTAAGFVLTSIEEVRVWTSPPLGCAPPVLAVVTENGNGELCFDLTGGCEDLRELILDIDGERYTREVSSDEIDLGQPLSETPMPSVMCLTTQALTPESHDFDVFGRCWSGATYETSFTATTTKRPVALTRVNPGIALVEGNDPITFELEFEVRSGESITVSADFSAVDPNFVPGAETVTALGDGRYTVSYQPSVAASTSGTYDVHVAAATTTPGGDIRHRVQVHYAPAGFPVFHSPRATYRVAPPPRRPLAPDVTVLDALYDERTPDTTPVPLGGPLTAFPQSAPESEPDLDGSVVAIELSIPQPSQASPVVIEIRDQTRDGYFTAKVDASALTCETGTCFGTLEVPLVPLPAPSDEPSTPIQLSIRVVDPEGGATPWTDLDPSPMTTPIPETYSVMGQVMYSPKTWLIDETALANENAYFANVTSTELMNTPAAMTLVWVGDACGAGRYAYTDSIGRFFVTFDSVCGDGTVGVTNCSSGLVTPGCGYVYTLAKTRDPASGRHAAAAAWVGPWAVDKYDYDTNPQNWRLWESRAAPFVLYEPEGSLVVTFTGVLTAWQKPDQVGFVTGEGTKQIVFDPLEQALYLADWGRRSLEYYDEVLGRNEMPDLDIAFTPAETLFWTDSPTYYSPGLTPGFMRLDATDFGEGEIVAHETGHAFHNATTHWGGRPYNDFSEPMSNLHMVGITGSPTLWSPFSGRKEKMEFNGTYDPLKAIETQWDDAAMMFYAGRADSNFLEDFNDFVALNTTQGAIGQNPRVCIPLQRDGLSPRENRALADRAGCCTNNERDAWPEDWTPIEESQAKDCFLGNRQGYVWRLLFDLFDDDSPEPPREFGGVTTYDWDEIDGGFRTNHTGPRQDILVRVLDKYITPYVRPVNEDDPWRVGPGGMAEDVEDRGGVMTGILDVVDGMVCLGVISAETTEVLFEDVMGWDYDYNFDPPDGGCP